MKKIATTLLMLLFSNLCPAQIFKEWFRQNATQKEYLIEQIAQLKIYLELTEKGYKIAKEGLTTIGEIKRGEFKLHKNRFDSLLIVNPKVGSSSRLQQITDLHGRVNQTCERLPAELESFFNADQMAYINKVLTLVYDDCQSVLSNLFLVIRNGNLSMSDDQRIERIELCFQQMQDNYVFVKEFDQNTKLLARQLKNEQSEMIIRKNIHGLNEPR
ncbi:hypothetical protein SAMN04487995_5994 [Dyadobacter koreensis]|uniref:TerB family tellurite resistance protein n=1 Tax=Dyadobacter koreensis TaxID=408657 RepID=A0A1H7B080_9BACT|nr:hypothetical protein [Dyadobacter koreensis]SEJ69607.1 hypothetical protein SAMN04487995_5994 [Dyadobacter koreensis]